MLLAPTRMSTIGLSLIFSLNEKEKNMKKSYVALFLVIVMLVASIAAFGSLASAVGEGEARLTIEKITYNSTGGENDPTKVSTEDGEFATLLAKVSSLAPDVKTRYTITLLGDVKQTLPQTISLNENAEVRIKLGGYAYSYTGEGAAITVTGESALLRVDGGYDVRGDRGTVSITGEASSFVSALGGAKADIRNIDATYTSPAFILTDGARVTVSESYVDYIGEAESAVISAKSSIVSVKYTDINGGDTLSLLDLSSSDGYVEGGRLFLGSLVKSDDGECDVLSVGVDMETVTAFNFGSSNTTAYVLGGRVVASAAIASDYASSENLVFYYGGGEMVVDGRDPSMYGVQSKCSFVKDGEKYILVPSTSAVTMATTATLGEAPVVTTHTSYIKSQGADGIGRAIKSAATLPTVGISTLLQDAVVASNVSFGANEDVSVIIDLNGHTLTWESTGAKTFNTSKNIHYTFDGADVNGNRGKMVSNSSNMMFFYPRQNSTTGIINEFLITRIENADFVVTNMDSAGSSAFININSGDAFIKDITVTYTGEGRTGGSGTYVNLISFDHSAGPLVRAHLEGVKAVNTDTSGIKVYPVLATESSQVYASALECINTYYAASVAGAAHLTVVDLKADVSDIVFSGSGKVDVFGCDVKVKSGTLGSSGEIYLHPVETAVKVDCCGNSIGGIWTSDEDYAMVPDSDYVYKLTSGVKAPAVISMPVYFANGMILQRGKTINVFGYIDDPDAELRVTLGDRVGTGKPDETGRFEIALDPIDEPTWGLTLTIEQTNCYLENKISFTKVNIGELWVISGQSNAQLQIGYIEDVDELATLADTYKNIYTYRANAGFSLKPNKYGSANWYQVTGKQVRGTGTTAVSAVGYAVAVKLAAELGEDVPIGIVHVARGASKIKTWLDYESLVKVSPSEAKKYDDCVAKGELPTNAHTQIGTCLYNQQIAPLTGLEVAGVVWYQGCGDVSGTALGTDGATYTDYFTALEGVYRRTFGNDSELPFYVMQLAPYTQDSASEADDLSRFKAEQFDMCRSLNRTYLVPLANEGGLWGESLFSQGYIHPGRKSPIGYRTGDMILEQEYGMELGTVAAPMPVSAVTVGDAVVVTFDTDIELLFGDTVMGFEIKSGSTWYDAVGVIDGNTITLTAPSAVAPTEVRYGFGYITAELEDGTLIPFLSSGSKADKTNKTITYTYNGKSYVIDDNTGTIRTIDFGNVTNASGVPMTVFSIACE